MDCSSEWFVVKQPGLRKVYARILLSLREDADASADGDLRIIDETGEDYLYPSAWFISIDVPDTVQQSVLRATG